MLPSNGAWQCAVEPNTGAGVNQAQSITAGSPTWAWWYFLSRFAMLSPIWYGCDPLSFHQLLANTKQKAFGDRAADYEVDDNFRVLKVLNVQFDGFRRSIKN